MSPKKHTLISWDFPFKRGVITFLLIYFSAVLKGTIHFYRTAWIFRRKTFLGIQFPLSALHQLLQNYRPDSVPLSAKICLTLNTFICQRKVQIKFKKTTFKKCANVGRGKCAKSWRQNPQQIQNNSAKSLHQRTCMELQKKKTYPVG